MLGCVEFPGGFFLGVKDDADQPHSMLARVQLLLRDQDDVVLVDLSRNHVTSASPRLPVTFKVRTRVGPARFILCFPMY